MWRRDRAAALVKLLATAPQHRLHREQIMDLSWPEAELPAAGAGLRKAVHYARKALGHHDLLRTSGDVVALAPDTEFVVDAERFEIAAAALRAPTPAACEAAADLYRGLLLTDDLYVDWLDGGAPA